MSHLMIILIWMSGSMSGKMSFTMLETMSFFMSVETYYRFSRKILRLHKTQMINIKNVNLDNIWVRYNAWHNIRHNIRDNAWHNVRDNVRDEVWVEVRLDVWDNVSYDVRPIKLNIIKLNI